MLSVGRIRRLRRHPALFTQLFQAGFLLHCRHHCRFIRQIMVQAVGTQITRRTVTATVTFDPDVATVAALAQATTNAGYPSTAREVK